MRKILIIIIFSVLNVTAIFAQLVFNTSTVPSTCNSNGSITVNASGGTAPYVYQIISSSVGVIRPAQNQSVFNNLPSGTYTIRVTDAASGVATNNNIVIAGNYIPLAFTYTQQQSKLIITPTNGKSPYKFSYSTNGGLTYTTPIDSGIFHCMSSGTYLFRVYDSCNNYYTEGLVVNDVNITASFSCSNNNTGIVLNAISGGNGGYIFNAVGSGYNQTNTTGNFTGINRCNRSVIVNVKDKCNLIKSFPGCVTDDYSFNVSCVNFKDKTVTLGNISGTGNIPFQYIANNAISNQPFIQNIPNATNSMVVGIIDSCGYDTTILINKMKVSVADSQMCKSGAISLKSYYQIGDRAVSFPPTRFTSISGPTSFDETATDSDTSIVEITNLQTGTYTYKVTNACGDEVISSFNYTRQCYKSILFTKQQTCNSLIVKVFKDCELDTNVIYKLRDINNNLVSQNNIGIFNGILNNDSCYKLEMTDVECDTTIFDNISPYKPQLKYFQNACNEINIGYNGKIKRNCGPTTVEPAFVNGLTYVLMDSLYNTIQTSTSNIINPIPTNTHWIYGTSAACNSDTIKYIKRIILTDTIRFCISPSVKYSNGSCKVTWQVKMTNNIKNTFYHLVSQDGTVDLVSNNIFIGVDSGRYILKDGCNEQELYLPNYYNFKTTINQGCPNNASVTASYSIDDEYITRLANQYFFTICNEPIIDYNIKEIGSSAPLTYSLDGEFNNLKTGTYYVVYYKGNATCNYFSDTIFTPFYVRPAITATYGLICNGNNATVKASVVGGTKPYKYEVLNSSIPDIVTDSNSVLYTNLPLGIAEFRVSDACGISTSFSTEVLSVNFEPTFKKKCDGTVQLIAPDIFNTEYVWTNKNNDTIGTTPTVYTTPNGNDSFKVTIKHLNCTLNKTLYVSDFSSSLATADAGVDMLVDTSIAFLQGNSLSSTSIGTWRQIDPSSGNSVFADIHNPNTQVSVNTFPGIYTYVWSVNDTSIGCFTEDTVLVSYLRCPNILPVLYTKTVKEGSCNGSAQIEIKITQSSTPVHYTWSNGDTTATIKNLTDSFYVVIIHDETTCTDDIYDTTFLQSKKSTANTLNLVACDGDTIKINNKNYVSTGNYADTLVNSIGCDSVLTINLTFLANSKTYDTLNFCDGNSFTLPNGQVITQTGDYVVKLTNSLNCDSIKNYSITFYPTVLRTIDTFICKGFNYQLPNGNTINQSGKYIDSFRTTLGCDSIITTNLIVKDTLQTVFIGNDTTICDIDKILIELNYPTYANYVWQDSSTTSNYTINKDGLYYVKVYDGCTQTNDTINVKTKDCTCYFYIPTAFSPNNDGINDVFSPFIRCEYYTGYSLTIFNRWSELVFKTNDINIGWNGFSKNEIQATDSYEYFLEYFDVLRNERIIKKGIITLIR